MVAKMGPSKETKGAKKMVKGPKMPSVEMVVVENTRASGIGLPGELSPDGTTVNYGLRLLPGENDVPAEEWERVRKNKTVKMYLDQDILIDKGKGKAKKLTDGLDALEKHEALKQIAKCEAPKILENWYSKTEKINLRNKIQEKLAAIAADEEKD
jgi:hypothetical protein